MLRDEAGFVAGAEALILGVLVFVFGTLVILNGWAVLDAKFATNAAAREAVRAVTDAEAGVSADSLQARAAGAATEAVAAHGYSAEVVTIEHLSTLPPGRCEAVRVRANITVRSTILPGIAGPATFAVGSEHEEVLDPFRSGFAGEADCGF
jgi:hypothetical protein